MSYLISLIAITNIHTGTLGSAISVVDNPVYRDAFNKIIIKGESLKGAIRSALYFAWKRDLKWGENPRMLDLFTEFIFGSSEESPHISLVSVSDAPLIFIPTTALRYKVLYITSPELLNRFLLLSNGVFKEDCCKKLAKLVSNLEKIKDTNAFVYPLNGSQTIDFSAEVSLNVNSNSNLIKPLYDLLRFILETAGVVKVIEPFGLAVVSDSIFDFIIDRALIIKPRVKLIGRMVESNTEIYSKNVDTGPWFEEEIPKFSIFMSKLKLLRYKNLEFKKFVHPEMKNLLPEILEKVSFDSVIRTQDSIKIFINKKEFVEKLLTKLKSLSIGGNEALNKGLVRVIKINNVNIEENITPIETNENETYLPIKRMKDGEIIDLIKKINGNNKQTAKDIQGRLSALPERIKRLGFLATYLFYTKFKSDAERKGYTQVIELLKELAGESIDAYPEIFNGYFRIKIDKISDYLRGVNEITRALTKMKYIIRSYVSKED